MCNFKNILFKKSIKNFKNKLIFKITTRKKDISFKRMYLNNKKTKFYLKHLKTEQEIKNYLFFNTFEDFNKGFIVNKKLFFDTNFFVSKIDLLVLDLNWYVYDFFVSLEPNTKLKKFKKTSILVILPIKTIDYLKIKKTDIVKPFRN